MDLNDNEMDILDDDGDLAIPTMRGDANLDIEDYARSPGVPDSELLADELQEDTPSTPGRNPGAAAAPDVDGTSSFDIAPEADMDAPGMQQTDFGQHPWGPGSSSGYRPFSMERTGMDLSGSDTPKPAPRRTDSMMSEPEVIEGGVARVPMQKWSGMRNQMPSNRGVDPETLYDHSSYERDDSTQDVIGSGIFDNPEDVTWRPRDGQFAHDYALPEYIAQEDELGVEQSQMWDSVADEWRVVQPSAGGVTLSRAVDALRPSYSPFVAGSSPPPEGSASHIEAFGKEIAQQLVDEAKTYAPTDRSRFLSAALESMGPGMSARCKVVSDRLITLGYPREKALVDTIAHCVMHATVKDVTKSNGMGALPRLDRVAKMARKTRGTMQASASMHVAPLMRDRRRLQHDLHALYASSARQGMGQVAPDTATTPTPGVTLATSTSIVTPMNVLLVGAVGLGGYLLWRNRKALKRNAKKVAKKLGLK